MSYLDALKPHLSHLHWTNSVHQESCGSNLKKKKKKLQSCGEKKPPEPEAAPVKLVKKGKRESD